MPTRRSVLAASGAAAAAATAGCLDFLLGSDDLSFEATAASVSESALSSTGYEHRRTEPQSVEREFSVGGESRTVGITNQRAQYEKSVSIGGAGSQPAATFSVVTSPKAEVLGQTFNPLAELEASQIVGMAQGRYEGLGGVEKTDERTHQLLGKETTVEAFEGSAEIVDGGPEVTLRLHVSEAVSSGDDYALVAGGYPRAVSSTEQPNFFTLVDGVQHDG